MWTLGAIYIFEQFNIYRLHFSNNRNSDNRLTLPTTPFACFCFCCFPWGKGTAVGFFFKGFFFLDLGIFLGPLLFCCHPPFALFLLASICCKPNATSKALQSFLEESDKNTYFHKLYYIPCGNISQPKK